ncbi:hypothetical protein [Kitasatospora sp. NPDC058478]|uniref:hypothetical protein n=1 Tax=unclassified Kitasatospora TaxID=2633591 RepID=UPI0036649E8D
MMTEQPGDTAERLLPIAAGLACIVRGEGGPREIAHILGELGDHERDVMIVVLAGLVDPDRPVAEVLGYLTWDEHGRPTSAPTLDKTLREIAVMPNLPSPLISWLKAERQQEARMRYRTGETQGEIAQYMGVDVQTVGRWIRAGVAA